MTAPTSPDLNPDQQNAYDVMLDMLRQWGLDTLAPDVLKMVQAGNTSQQISFLLQDTQAYKERFAGNEIRRKQGLRVLSPAEYLATEASYKQILSSNGLPQGFYDSPSDFAGWIGRDVSPNEINQRVNMAVDTAQRVDSGMKQALMAYHGIDDQHIAAYFLDQDRALPLIQQQSRGLKIGAAAFNAGDSLTREQAENLATSNIVSDSQIDQTMQQVEDMSRRGGFLGQLYGQNYNTMTAASEAFFANLNAQQMRQNLVNTERGTFSGNSGLSKGSLAQPAQF